MKPIDVSVIVLTNHELLRAKDSVLRRQGGIFGIILVDDSAGEPFNICE
jgi:hypothetical protein